MLGTRNLALIGRRLTAVLRANQAPRSQDLPRAVARLDLYHALLCGGLVPGVLPGVPSQKANENMGMLSGQQKTNTRKTTALTTQGLSQATQTSPGPGLTRTPDTAGSLYTRDTCILGSRVYPDPHVPGTQVSQNPGSPGSRACGPSCLATRRGGLGAIIHIGHFRATSARRSHGSDTNRRKARFAPGFSPTALSQAVSRPIPEGH
jgi:hypothetical protein